MPELPPLFSSISEIGGYIKLAVLASQRMLAAMMVIPFLSGGAMPGLPRHALVVVLTPFVIPLIPAEVFNGNLGWLYYLSLSIREVSLGVFIGMVIAAPLIVLEGVGHALDFQSGLSNAAVYDPSTNEESGPFARMFTQVAIWLLFGPVGILAVVSVLMLSFELWPITTSGPFGESLGYQTAAQAINGLFRMTLTLAAPPVVALLLIELSLGLVGRFAQQLDVNVSAMPLKTLVAAATAGLMLSYVLDIVREERSWSDRALHFMRDATIKRAP